MKLSTQKKLAAKLTKSSPKRIKLDTGRLEDIKEAITKEDIRGLIKDDVIVKKQKKGVTRVNARKRQVQKQKGRQKGAGNRKGTKTARNPPKRQWINKIRLLRELLKDLREKGKLDDQTYKSLYNKAKGGYFRSRRHLKTYITENQLVKQE